MNQMDGIAALIPAAGHSSRMGAFKPLLRIGKDFLIERTIRCFLDAGVRDVTVVLGYRPEMLVPILRDAGVRWVLNDRFASGMLSSILAGVNSLGRRVEAFFVLPCDMPSVGPATVRALMQAYIKKPSPVVLPLFRGRRGHPPLIARDAVRGLEPEYEGGLGAFLKNLKGRELAVEVDDEGVLLDCDTPEDYRMLLQTNRRRSLRK